MEKNTQDQPVLNNVQSESSVQDLSFIVETTAGENAEQGTAFTDGNDSVMEKKKYHSSAMYAANVWHSTIKHVKHNHNHRGLNL